MPDDKDKKLNEERELNEKKEPIEITFSHGFGGILLVSLTAYSPVANAGSFVIGPCGTHNT